METIISDAYALWMECVRDKTLRSELEKISADEKAIENKFYKELQFGTGGLRGEIGVGTNCLNIYTIGKATQGVAAYVNSIGGKIAVISYDSRINSDVFARRAACVFAENGISVYIVKELMPTPFLSFATRFYKADIGIMITASHNPSKYNGYKVYGSDGCQITDAVASAITRFIADVNCFAVKTGDFSAYVRLGKIRYVDDQAEESYLQAVEKQSVCKAEGVSVTYTPLNGTGYRIVPKMLARMGVHANLVKEQAMPDGNFPTCPYPNPEKPAAMELGIRYASHAGSDILLATDPDADRVGVAVKTPRGYQLLSGNEVGVLLMDYLLSERKKKGTLPCGAVVVKTIVTTKLAEKIAQKYGVTLINVLTGFKYIGEQITKLEKEEHADRFILGFEESYGYLSGSYVRDKDAVVAVMLIVEMVSHYKRQGKTLADRMEEIYHEYGTYSHKLLTFEFSGADGAKKMESLLKRIRESIPKEFAGMKVMDCIDYLTQRRYDLPKSNVLQFDLERGAQVIVRPSGTEPQIKIYLTVAGMPSDNVRDLALLEESVKKLFSV